MSRTTIVFGTDEDCLFRNGKPLAFIDGTKDCHFLKSDVKLTKSVVLHGTHPQWTGLHIAKDLRQKLKEGNKILWVKKKDSVILETKKPKVMIRTIMRRMVKLKSALERGRQSHGARSAGANPAGNNRIVCYAISRRNI